MVLKHKLDFIQLELNKIKNENLYRKLRNGRISGSYIKFGEIKAINLSSNDYLGLQPKNIVLKQMQSSSRLIAGNDVLFEELEKKLSHHKEKQDTLVYPTGYMANLGVVSTIAKKGDVILSDELNHASIIEACKLSGATVVIYNHNDVSDLEKKIKRIKKQKFIVTEGVFSMDGDLAKLKEITQVAEKNDGVLILDDAHGDFVFGDDGKGTAHYQNVQKKIDFYISSLSKGLGSFGGYVSTRNIAKEYLINKSKTFIYTSALPSSLIENSLQRLKMNREQHRKGLFLNVTKISNGLKYIGYSINSPSHIIPIVIGDEKITINFGKDLLKEKIFAQPIRYPTVPKNTARLRISITSWLNDSQIEKALNAFEKIGKKYKII